MFNRITIIGVGLIGGSLALALRKHKLAKEIIGCSRSQTTLNKALALDLIDYGFVNPARSVVDSEMVVLATPLSTYSDITTAIVPRIAKRAIIIDTGSVKEEPTQNIFTLLDKSQQGYLVPAHPIAGTEKSGPEAAFDSLYKNKMVVLTPISRTNKTATAKVQKMWEAIGANVKIMEASRHDYIYANVSHNVQFLSSCFGLALYNIRGDNWDKDIFHYIVDNADNNFRQFVRLVGSDATMWRDIFTENSNNLLEALGSFKASLDSLKTDITKGNKKLTTRLKKAQRKRLHFHKLLQNEEIKDFRVSDYSTLDDVAYVWMGIMPRLIACAVMENIEESEYSYATGAGLHGFTRNIILDGGVETDDIIKHKDKVTEAIDTYFEQIRNMVDIIISEDIVSLHDTLLEAQEVYFKM